MRPSVVTLDIAFNQHNRSQRSHALLPIPIREQAVLVVRAFFMESVVLIVVTFTVIIPRSHKINYSNK